MARNLREAMAESLGRTSRSLAAEQSVLFSRLEVRIEVEEQIEAREDIDLKAQGAALQRRLRAALRSTPAAYARQRVGTSSHTVPAAVAVQTCPTPAIAAAQTCPMPATAPAAAQACPMPGPVSSLGTTTCPMPESTSACSALATTLPTRPPVPPRPSILSIRVPEQLPRRNPLDPTLNMLLAKPPPPVAAARLRFALSPDGEPAPSPARDTDTCPAPATAPACPAPATSPACPAPACPAPATAPACPAPATAPACPAPATAPACPAPACPTPACPAPATAPACAVPSVRQELQSLQQDTLALQTQANGLLSEIQDARQSTVGAIDDLKSLFENLHATLRRSRERLRPEDDDDDDDEDDDGAGGARGCYTVLEGPELRKLCRGLSEACRAVESLRELLALEPRSRANSPPAECEKLRI
ncbi:TPA_asm: MC107L [Molluscum contagiosum virus]|uniref:MC107L n=1 Tax=Molluscum contagiosum virus TaxID=10279 RepID=A0A858A0H9_9POXV|nr:MC107 [Molluscum contagiosum virus subtype 1]QHW16848.1 MC107L [Molluscum contagiosum virus]QHW17212.1 MC107L [Molluscum contagiosum virus]DBA37903.1 TPA_asm: MC107L [Molluscum contagiosum virus]DBA38082.1 TPA_asm: MC107L [Molluscum contagiosum virus]